VSEPPAELRAARAILQLGAGERELERAPGDRVVRVDVRPDTRPDVTWDLDRFPWPFEDGSFDAIDCTDVLEHLDDIVRVMEEIHRIGRPGCRVTIATPHFSCANSFTDPTHRHHFGIFSFDYFTGDNQWGFYTKVRFAKTHAAIFFYPGLVNAVIRRVARRWPELYERRLAWIFPAWFIHVVLEVRK
jgi:SAM-dependent methyltransferase